MTEFTSSFRFPIPDFEQEPWHDVLEEAIRSIDTAIHDALVADEIATWTNSTAFIVGAIVVDPQDGSIWVAAVAHTSPASPTLFATDRTNNPTRWNSPTRLSTNRGNWASATSYVIGDFVVNANRYAVCIVSHVSTVFNTDLAAGKWSVLIDLSTLGVGINALAEDTIASAATTDIGTKTATRISVSGTATVTSFGNTADTFKILRYTVDNAVITHHATDLILLGAANRTMRAGDIQWVASNSVQKWREIAFFRADANPATATERGVVELADTTEAQAGTDTIRAMTAARVKELIYALFMPATTAVVFFQAAAPTGWTKQTAHGDKAIRIVSGVTGGSSSGTVAFSTCFGRTTTDGHTLLAASLPSANVTITDTRSAKFRCIAVGTGSALDTAPGAASGTGAFNGDVQIGASGAVSGSIDGATNGSHTHPIDLRVQYLDCIICTKN